MTPSLNREKTEPLTRVELVTQEPAVNWLSPVQLLKTGLRVLMADMVGGMSDPRLVHAALTPEAAATPTWRAESKDDGDGAPFWLDYLADTGDGWDSTYSVAWSVAREQLDVPGAGALPRAQVLVLGGDQVYPTPADQAYRTRFLDPFRSALPSAIPTAEDPSAPKMVAIPGNHDWYDGLSGFMRLFASGGSIGRWQTVQKRSYFALQLPHGWWLWGLDLQLASEMDAPQYAYFKAMAAQLRPGDRVVLCPPEPSWADPNVQLGENQTALENVEHLRPRFTSLRQIEALIARRRDEDVRLAAVIAGDSHHYARYAPWATESADAPQRITCGGGGAYLLGTHGLLERLRFRGGAGLETHQRVATFPSVDESRALRDRAWRLPVANPVFGLTLAGVYAVGILLALSAGSAVCRSPWAWIWALSLVLGAGLFTRNGAPKTGGSWGPLVGGMVHGALHVGLAAAVGWLGRAWPGCGLVAAGAVTGWIGGGLLFGLWLMLSNRWLGWHDEESFSAQAITDHRSFLRMRIDAEGLTIYPLGIRKACTRWQLGRGIELLRQAKRTWRLRAHTGSGPRFEPVDPIQVELIEAPISVKRARRA
ncbi:preprotein translocase subunit YajC [Leptothrix ochracea]|uniref:preprotein translocase subunit YajC n=2 Tax=Leptothrix ochracea TaxID=735331 RepID=UPI0034E2341C